MKIIFVLSFLAYTSLALSIENTSQLIKKIPHEPTDVELQALYSSDSFYEKREYTDAEINWRPVEDTADFKYVLMSAETGFSEVSNLRYTIAKNLPTSAKLVILANRSDVNQVRQNYLKYISADRLILAVSNDISGGFWARDSFPYPIANDKNQLSLVSAKYYRTFNASPSIAESLQVNMSRHNFTFVGGNLIADENANCFTIDSYRKFSTTENDLINVYGCKKVNILKHFSGIGDVDEVIKPIGKNRILTNTTQYVTTLKNLGYEVIMLPSVPNSYRTYANSLIVDKTVFMPTYGISKDSEAQKVYESLGYKVIGIPSNTLSDDMHGSIHCQTMAYPQIDESILLAALNLKKVD